MHLFAYFVISSFIPILFSVIYLKWLSSSSKTHKNLPPSPWKLPIIGNLHQVGINYHRSFQKLARNHGPLMLLHLGSVPVVVVSAAHVAQEILKTYELVFLDRGESDIIWKITYGGKDIALSNYGEYWRQLRSIVVLHLLSNRSVQSFQQDIFAAATDTTFTTLEWAFSELLKNPLVMKNLQKEVSLVAEGKEKITEDDIGKLEYLNAVLKETMRLHAPAPIIPRASSQDVKIMGYDIEKGTRVAINAWAISRDPTIWADSEEFRPERFLNSSIDYKGSRFEFIPFGAGRRGCPGIQFANTLVKLALANVVYKFDLALPGGEISDYMDMSETAALTVHKLNHLLLVATPRSAIKLV